MLVAGVQFPLMPPLGAPLDCANISWRCPCAAATFPVPLDFALEAGTGSARGRAALVAWVACGARFLSGRFGYAENLS
jgi:hypothetical protein